MMRRMLCAACAALFLLGCAAAETEDRVGSKPAAFDPVQEDSAGALDLDSAFSKEEPEEAEEALDLEEEAAPASPLDLDASFAEETPQPEATPAPVIAPVQTPAPQAEWTCRNGHRGNTGDSCAVCGEGQPVSAGTCVACGFAFPEGTEYNYCPICGKKRPAAACAACGFAFPEGSDYNFCPICGEPAK